MLVYRIITMVLLSMVTLPSATVYASFDDLKLWYRQPAEHWIEALAVGNGRLGAMVFGKIANERIQFNEDTVWAGGPYKPVRNSEGPQKLPHMRRLVFEGKYLQAQNMFGPAMKVEEWGYKPYQPAGDLWLSFPGHEKVQSYKRELNLDTAIARVIYRVGDVRFTREVFSSPIDQAIVVRLTADKPGKISFTAKISGAHKTNATVEDNLLVLRGSTGGPLRYEARLKTITKGGKTTFENDTVTVKDADVATLLLVAASNFVNYKDLRGNPQERTEKYLTKIGNKSYEKIRNDHIREHQRLFRRVEFELPATEASRLPTDERLKKFSQGDDPQLAALFFQFGRYLLISSSRQGCEPANLQGIWNESLNPSWDCKYTTNINVEMNYWPADVSNLGECLEPLVAMVEDWAQTGSYTARHHYGARGWVQHFNSDIWRVTAPMGGGYFGAWHGAGPWCCWHLWEHYLFSEDKQYLQRIYPIMKGAALFFTDTLQEHPKHKWLVTCPSNSPENWYKVGDNPRQWDRKKFDRGEMTTICAGPTMDMQLLRHLFDSCIEASKILNVDQKFRKQLQKTKERLAPNQIGRLGQLQEWLDDWDYPEDDHRHFSHLWGMYPGREISTRETPKLAKAVRKSLVMRGEGGTGFGMTWQMCLWARMYEGETALRLFGNLVRQNTCANLFSKCYTTLQVDGSFGCTAGIAEMLLQSHEGVIHLLPALPKAWSTGMIKGLKARGGFEVDIEWQNGKLASTTINSARGHPRQVRYGNKVVTFKTKKGESLILNGNLDKID
jgi:alpha-L-fucosidase 2